MEPPTFLLALTYHKDWFGGHMTDMIYSTENLGSKPTTSLINYSTLGGVQTQFSRVPIQLFFL